MAEEGKYLIGESLRAKLKSTIAKVDSIPFGGPVTRLAHGSIGDGPTFIPKVFRVCTATGSWPAESSKTVTFYGVTSTPNTVSVLNKLVTLPAPKGTTTTRIVNVAKDGTQWYLVSFQMSSKTAIMATNTQTITFMGTAATSTMTYISSCDTQTISFAGAGQDKTLTYVTSISEVDVVASVNATLDTANCKIVVTTTTTKIKAANSPTTTTFKTAGTSQTATIISLAHTQTATLMSTGGTQTATIMTGTYIATYISLEI